MKNSFKQLLAYKDSTQYLHLQLAEILHIQKIFKINNFNFIKNLIQICPILTKSAIHFNQ